MAMGPIIIISVLVIFVLFILWASKSIARAIVFAVVIVFVLPIVMVIGFAMLAATDEGGRPQQRIEKTKR
jgi:hypothetical protein